MAAPVGQYEGYPIYVSDRPQKKYYAVVGRARVHFGDRRYQQYRDRVGVYAHLDHGDKERRRRYKKRHERDRHKRLTPGWFADRVLW